MKNQLVGWILVAASALIPLIWFLPLALEHDASAVFSQWLGIVALIVMAITMIIATRLPGTSFLFGPLDRAYVMHKWLGVGAMVAILLHDTIDADIDGLGRETFLSDFGETLGELSLYGLLALVILSVATFTPYKLWKWTHRVMGAFFIAGALHFLFILKPFEMLDPPGIYTGVFCIAGILAYIYATLMGLLKRGRNHQITTIKQTGDALAITLKPTKKPISVKAGQFAFLSFDALPEPHPFTISKVSADGSIRFTIKALGDYTRALPSVLESGMSVGVRGPYGGFTRKPGSPEIWIAAGVGITPFAAWANELESSGKPVHLFYSVKSRSAASHLNELTEAAERIGLKLHLHETSVKGRLDIDQIISETGSDFSQASVSFCGPVAMREQLQQDFVLAGMQPGRFHFEMFELRSGIGFRKVLDWLLRRLPLHGSLTSLKSN